MHISKKDVARSSNYLPIKSSRQCSSRPTSLFIARICYRLTSSPPKYTSSSHLSCSLQHPKIPPYNLTALPTNGNQPLSKDLLQLLNTSYSDRFPNHKFRLLLANVHAKHLKCQLLFSFLVLSLCHFCGNDPLVRDLGEGNGGLGMRRMTKLCNFQR